MLFYPSLMMVKKPEVCVWDCGEQRAVLPWILYVSIGFEWEFGVKWLLAMDIRMAMSMYMYTMQSNLTVFNLYHYTGGE